MKTLERPRGLLRHIILGILATQSLACSDDKDPTDDGELNGGAAGEASGGTTNVGGTAGSGGSSGVGSAGVGTGGTGATAECHDLAPPRDPIVLELGVGTAPEPEGGAPVAGLYYGSTLTLYESDEDCLNSVRQLEPRYALRIEAESEASGLLSSLFSAGEQEFRSTGSYSAQGTTLVTTPTCGGSAEASIGFTATSTSLMLFANSGSCGPGVFLYTRQ